jgi:hypothetical protein
MRELNLSAEQTQAILFQEVFPVLAPNMMQVAGEWAGWSDAWLLEQIPAHLAKTPHPLKSFFSNPLRSWIKKEIEKQWQAVLVQYNQQK